MPLSRGARLRAGHWLNRSVGVQRGAHPGSVSRDKYCGKYHISDKPEGRERMKYTEAYTVSIGLLAVVDTYLTASLLPIPVWVTFIAWASFFVLGGGVSGLFKSVVSNWVGVVISSLTLLAISTSSEAAWVAAILVGIGSAAMVQASRIPFLSVLPAIVFGFASTVGTVGVTGLPITTPDMSNPALIAATALLVGGLFGFISERFGDMLISKPAV